MTLDANGSDVATRRVDAAVIAVLDRPDKRNAIRRETYERLLAILAEVAADREVRALVLTGAGSAFSAGIDIDHLAARLDAADPERALEDEIEALAEITRRMRGLAAVVIAAVNGPAHGLGVELCLAADVRIASRAARFSLPEASMGFFPTSGALHLLPRLVGHGRAAAMLLAGEAMSADEALAAGLVTRVVPSDELVPAALEIARGVAAGAPLSIQLLKDGLARAESLDLEGCMALEGEALRRCMAAPDAAARIRGFVARRAAARGGRPTGA
jgi:enoyl-CoA hydratase/carnithine racemase